MRAIKPYSKGAPFYIASAYRHVGCAKFPVTENAVSQALSDLSGGLLPGSPLSVQWLGLAVKNFSGALHTGGVGYTLSIRPEV